MTLDALLTKWLGKQGAGERAEYQQFLTEFMQALGVPTPGDAGVAVEDYRFEAPVRSEAVFGTKSVKRADLYKRDAFILEAKQSQAGAADAPAIDEPAGPATETVFDLFGNPIGQRATTDKPRRRYDRLMADARVQAERYALALPEAHRAPPFLIVADVGRAFELYFDWSGNGRGYGPFPDERHYRIRLEALTDPTELPGVDVDAAALLRAIWTDPASVDPRLKAAAVTRDIAQRLSNVAKALETNAKSGRADDVNVALGIEESALFLMRVLFCMFAEDVELLPKDSFKLFLESAQGKSENYWRSGLSELWSRMNDPQPLNRYWSHGDAVVRHFNGNLFHDVKVFTLDDGHRGELLTAAKADWKKVEPAIFGTLLEQVLTVSDRAKLGAHYTPRSYVQRLVDATMMEVLRGEWDDVREAVAALLDPLRAGEELAEALALIREFQQRLHAVRVLDPACGTGNFLYVAMEELLRLEGDVRAFAEGLGEVLPPLVEPNQLLGLELNPRAAVIAELVLWIGWLRYRLANSPEAIGDPVLPTLKNINLGRHGGYDAVVARDEIGAPVIAQPEWPAADFIVGNPPFIGGKDIRDRLGSDYAEALWRANPRVPKSADFVMQWWDRAADILTQPGTRLRRFGFVTTNSITQVFSRRVIEGWLSSPLPSGEGIPKLHLTLAIPDHPWTRVTRDAAAVRIAMTVAEAGPGPGRVVTIVGERGLDTDLPVLDEQAAAGAVNADLSVGTDLGRIVRLQSNRGICHDGVKLHGKGFSITATLAQRMGLQTRLGLEKYIRPYRNGRDLTGRTEGEVADKYVIDLFGLSEIEILERFPEVYQHLLTTVKPERDKNRRGSYRKNWWIFGEPRRDLRPALVGLQRFLVTVDTAKHRIFQFLPSFTVCDDKLVVIADESIFTFGVVSSAIHLTWTSYNQGQLEDRPVYVKTACFDPFCFPVAESIQVQQIAVIAELLDQTRRTALVENPKLTMTGLYNLVEEARANPELPPEREAAVVKARARIVAKLHDDLDAAVAAAYGWEWPLAPAEIVARLVALNTERAAEEAAGTVRWLRPEYQVPRFAKSA